MPGLDDPRYLQQTIADLEKRLKKLEGSALKLAANQQGAIPGAMRAVTIGDPGLGSAMWLNLSGNQPGQAPYMGVTDGNRVVRAEIGNLAANGISPAQMGFRASDASGAPIFDSLGLIGVMTSLGNQAGGNQGNFSTASASTWADVAASTFTLTVTRPVFILYMVFATGFVVSGTGSGYIRGNLVGFNTSASIIQGTPGTQSGFIWFYPNAGRMPAGTYTAKMQVATDSGTTYQLVQFFHQAFVLGG